MQLANLTTTFALESAQFVNGAELSRAALGKLQRQLDPLGKAQAQFNSQTRDLKVMLDAGALSVDKYNTMMGNAERQLQSVIARQQIGTAATGSMRIGFQQLGYQLDDVSQGFAMGTSAATIFAQQSGQVIQALQLMTIETKGFLAFLGGPWGAVLSAALVVATPFVAKIFEGGDALDKETDKLRKSAEQSRVADQAKERFGNTLEGVTQAIQDQRKALGELADADKTAAERADDLAKAHLRTVVAIRAATAAAAEQAALLAENAKSQNIFAGGPGGAQSLVSAQYAAEAEKAAARAKNAEDQVKQARLNLEQSDYELSAETAKRMADPIQVITKKYDDQIAAIQNADRALIQAGQHARADSAARITALEKEKKAAIEAYEAANRASNDNRQTGRQISLTEAEAIVKSIGGTITSTTRSFAQQSALYAKYLAGTGSLAAKPGHSDHELGNALDIAKTPGMSLARIREAFTEAGVSIKQLLDEGNHFHVAWTADSKAAAEASKNEAAAIKLIRDASTGAFKALSALDADQHKTITKLFGDDAKDWDKFTKDAQTAFDAQQNVEIDNERDLQRIREDHLRSLGDLYYDLFDGGTKRIWQDFQRQGFDIISKLLAQWTMAAINPVAGQDKGGFFSNLFSAVSRSFGGGNSVSAPAGTFNIPGIGSNIPYIVPGFASGGSFQFGGRDGIDKNILSLNGSPIAKVSKGETATIGRGGAGGATNVFDLRGAVVTQDLLDQMNALAASNAIAVVNDNNKTQAKRAGRRLGR